MKRLFNKLLATSLSIAIILCNTPVYAANEQYNSSVTAEVESSYIVSIPKSIELDVNTIGVGTGNYTCYAYGDIEATSSVYIVPSSQFTMTKDSSDDSTIATVSQDKTEWEYNDMNSESPVVGNGSISTNGLTAGNWNGVFYFNIEKTDSGSDVEAPVDETVEIELVDSEVVDAGTFTLGRSQVGAVQLSYKDEDVTYDAEYTSDNKNITVSDTGIINTDNATGGETATITVEYTPTESEQLDTASYSLRAAASEVSDSSTLSAYFTVQVIDIEFDKEALTLYQGDTATITANIVPDEVDGTVKWTLSGLDFGSEGNTITITVAIDATPGNYVLSASYGSYTQSLNIKIVENETHSHLYSSEVTTQPTCTTSGVKTFTCSCGDSYTEEVAATGHSWEDDFTIDVEPTCTTVGSKSVHCANCSETKYVTEIPATGHTYVDGKCDCGDVEATYVTLRSPANETTSSSYFLSIAKERDHINSVNFVGYEEASTHYLTDSNCYDLSNSQDGSIIGWYVKHTGRVGYYDVYIAPTEANTKIQAHANCNYMFANLPSYVDITGLDTIDFSNTTKTDYFYYGNVDSKIEVPEGIQTIGNYAFYECDKLSSINIPDSVTSIGNFAFTGCTKLSTVNIPNNTVSIGAGAFSNCTSLSLTINVPDTVTSIGKNAFNNVRRVVYKGTASGSPWGAVLLNGVVIDGIVYDDNVTTLWGVESDSVTSVVVPDTVTKIEDKAFYYCSTITDITIPDTVTSIGESAFAGCSSLTSVVLSNSITKLNNDTFEYCSKLTDINMPNNLIEIGNNCFYSTAISSVTFPDTLTTIGEESFRGTALAGEVVLPDSIETIGANAFSWCYKSGTDVSIKLPTTVTTVGDNAFYYLPVLYYNGSLSGSPWGAKTVQTY